LNHLLLLPAIVSDEKKSGTILGETQHTYPSVQISSAQSFRDALSISMSKLSVQPLRGDVQRPASGVVCRADDALEIEGGPKAPGHLNAAIELGDVFLLMARQLAIAEEETESPNRRGVPISLLKSP
jgi:hypothetical protein